MLSVQMKQRVNLKFNLLKPGKTFTEVYAMLKDMYGNKYLPCTQDFEWLIRFKEGRETTENDPRTRRPSTSKTDENIEKIESTKNVFARFCMNRSTCAKMVPKLLTPEQKESRMNICDDIINNTDTDPGLLTR
ncbi:hypothetical protein NQ318_012064 [Aromia moschata]|uniref:Mos1 transposase HTH domain-containing protein n=1 Tax=Aromia moschata TaxID=1265417 RepID=A0AAV8Y533_9CUCU|nr:hypothetical protein NQ318_012064 [Aromia moschata]